MGGLTATGDLFATYNRESAAGLDYANQRYYASVYGRFNSPDPYRASGGAKDPGSWNRYAYVGGDPINYNDPGGLARCHVVGTFTTNSNPDNALEPVTTAEVQCTSSGGSVLATYFSVLNGTRAQTEKDWVSAVGAYLDSLDPGQCPLEAPTGNYKTSGHSVVALFAPDIAAEIDRAFGILNSEGVVPIITDGFRTLTDQTNRYNNYLNGASPYPAAVPGTSIHEIGEGVDFGINTNGASNFTKIRDALISVGLTWGQSFHDPVHFEQFHTPSKDQVAACEREHP